MHLNATEELFGTAKKKKREGLDFVIRQIHCSSISFFDLDLVRRRHVATWRVDLCFSGI